MKLISHKDYENEIDKPELSDADFRALSRKHREFISKGLELGQFVPCDENDVPYESYHTYSINHNTICEPYEGLFEIDANKKCSGWKYLDPDKTRYYDAVSYEIAKEKYQQAKERVLFEGVELKEELPNVWILKYKGSDWYIVKHEKIEYLLDMEIELTESAKQQLK